MRVTTQVSGGQRMGQRIKAIQDRLRSNSGVYVGVPASAGTYESGESIAVIAAVQEFGSADGRIPERSFLRVPLRSNQQDFAAVLAGSLSDVLSGNLSMAQLMDQLGARAAATSQEAISAGIPPPNAPSTIQQKESSTPLIDSGNLRQNITWVVEGEAE